MRFAIRAPLNHPGKLALHFNKDTAVKQFVDSPNFLQTIRDEAARNSVEAEKMVAGLSDEQLSWIASPNTWSIAQCLDHLAVTSQQ